MRLNFKLILTFVFAGGLGATALASEVTLPTPGAKGAAPTKTVITSQTLEMVSGLTENTFYFSKNVHVVSNALDMKSDQMVVTSGRNGDPVIPGAKALPVAGVAKPLVAGNANLGVIQKIVGVGNVHIFQEGREAFSGRAECFPKEGKVVLTDNPRVVDSQAIVTGWRITLTQGEKRVLVEHDPSQTGTGLRPSIDLENVQESALGVKKATTVAPAALVPAEIKPAQTLTAKTQEASAPVNQVTAETKK